MSARTDADLRLADITLRDRIHTVDHQPTSDQIPDVAAALDAVAPELIDTQLSVLMFLGISTVEDVELAIEKKVNLRWVATHVTEADISEEHFEYVTDHGLEANGLLTLSYMVPLDTVLEQASPIEEYGAEAVYVMDSMGAMLPSDVRDQMHLLSEELFINVGFHTYNNLGLIIGNTLAGIEEDATTIDGCLRELGARSGNDQMEVLTGVLEKTGYDVDPDFFGVIDVAEILVDSGEMEVVDGQEDLIIDIAARLSEGGQVGAGCYD